MANRNYVKQLQEVKNLTKAVQELAKNEELRNDNFEKTQTMVANIADEYQKSMKYSKKSVDDSNKVSKVSKVILDYTKKQSTLNTVKLKLANLNHNIQKKILGINNEQVDELFEQINAEKEKGFLASKYAGLQEKAKNSFKTQILQGGIFIAIWGVLAKLVTAFSEKFDAIGKQFGMMASDRKFTQNLLDAETSAIKLGFGLDDVLSTVTTLSSEFGISLSEATNLSEKVLDTALATGLAVDESAKLFGALKSIVGLSTEEAEALTESTFQLAKQKGIAPTAVLQDMAASAEAIATFTDATGHNIAEAAVQARQLGVTLDTTAKIAEGLIDFQSSLSAEFEASMMIGRRLNLQRARYLALTGDLSGMMEEVVSQLGSAEEIERLLPIQRIALAKAIGVSTVELMKFVKGTKDLSVSGALASGEFANLIGPDAISGISKMMNKFKAFGAAVVNALGPTFDKVATIMSDWLGESGELTEDLSKKFTAFGEKVETFFSEIFTPAGEGALSLWDRIGLAIEKVPGFLSAVGTAIQLVIPTMIAFKLASIGAFLAQGMLTAAKAGFFAGPAAPYVIGATVAALAVGAGLLAASVMSFKDLPAGQSASLIRGQAIFDPGETVVHTNDLSQMGKYDLEIKNNSIKTKDEVILLNNKIDKLINNMDSYFGVGGRVYKQGVRVVE